MAAKAKTDDKDKEPTVKARSDAYTGMLLISLIVLIAGCALLYLDYSQYPSTKPPPLPSRPAASAPAPAEEAPKEEPKKQPKAK
jgi:hypothetical protein